MKTWHVNMKEKWMSYKSEVAVDFYSHIADIIHHESVLELDKYIQHGSYTRLTHSLNVAFVSYVIARLLGWDSRSTARAGLLHDLYFYDKNHKDYDVLSKGHLKEHPKRALENARKITVLNSVEEDTILKHMWLITLRPPRYREGYIVTFVDKYCAVKEFAACFSHRSQLPRSIFSSI